MKSKQVLLRVIHWFHYITIEPVFMLGMVGMGIRTLITSAGLYKAVCWKYYQDSLFLRCENQSTWPTSVENHIQRETANWDMYITLSYLIPAIFANIVFGSWSDLIGRQLNVMISLAGLTLYGLGMLLVFGSSVRAPLPVLVIFGFITGITGFIALFGGSSYAYIADITPDKRMQSIRMVILTELGTFGAAMGALVVSSMQSDLSLTVQVIILEFTGLLGLIYAIFRVWQIPPALLKAHQQGEIFVPVKNAGCGNNPLEFFGKIVGLVIDAFKAYFKPREDHRRAFLLAFAILLFIFATNASEPVQQYTFREHGYGALSWTINDLGTWTLFSKFLAMIVSGVTMTVLKLLKIRDTVAVIISMTSMCLKWVVIGLAQQSSHMYIASAVGSFQDMGIAGMVSFMAQLVEKDEVRYFVEPLLPSDFVEAFTSHLVIRAVTYASW